MTSGSESYAQLTVPVETPPLVPQLPNTDEADLPNIVMGGLLAEQSEQALPEEEDNGEDQSETPDSGGEDQSQTLDTSGEDDESGECDPSGSKTKKPKLLTDYYKPIPFRKITLSDTVILPATSTTKCKRNAAESGDDDPSLADYSWKSSSSDDSEVHVSLATAIERYRAQRREQTMKDGNGDGNLAKQDKITKFMKKDDSTEN